ncbi:hypothetical protein D9M69_468220 [compost metagenome]
MVVPGRHVLPGQVGQRHQVAVLAHAPDNVMGDLLVIPVDQAIFLQQVRRQDADVAAAEAVRLQAVAEAGDLAAALLGIDGIVADQQRAQAADAVVALRIAVDGFRGEAGGGALDGPLRAIGKGDQGAQWRQVHDLVDVETGHGPCDGVVVLQRGGIAEVGEHAGTAEAQGLRLVEGAGIDQPLLEVGHRAREIAGANERIDAGRRGVGLGRRDVVVSEAQGVGLADEAIDAGASVVLVDVVIGGADHGRPGHRRLDVRGEDGHGVGGHRQRFLDAVAAVVDHGGDLVAP